MLPLMAHNLLRGIDLLANATRAFTERSVVGITVNVEHCQATAARTLALATALAPVIGYDGAAEIAKEAHRSGRTIRAVAGERTDLSPERLDELLDPRAMTEPG
jgi:fumarate hydratase class II